MEVRSYQAPDAPALANLLSEMGYPASAGEADEYARSFGAHSGTTLVVAVEGSAVVGVAASCLVPRLDAERLSCRITDLVVAEASRGRGIGRALIAEIERQGRQAGATRLDLSTGDWRSDAHAFYERLGFVDNARALVRRFT